MWINDMATHLTRSDCEGSLEVLCMIRCGMAKKMGVLGVSVGKMRALTVKVETVTLVHKGRENLTYLVYSVYVINSKIFFLKGCFILGCHLRIG